MWIINFNLVSQRSFWNMRLQQTFFINKCIVWQAINYRNVNSSYETPFEKLLTSEVLSSAIFQVEVVMCPLMVDYIVSCAEKNYNNNNNILVIYIAPIPVNCSLAWNPYLHPFGTEEVCWYDMFSIKVTLYSILNVVSMLNYVMLTLR